MEIIQENVDIKRLEMQQEEFDLNQVQGVA